MISCEGSSDSRLLEAENQAADQENQNPNETDDNHTLSFSPENALPGKSQGSSWAELSCRS
jgi:hypothetical protein